MLSEFVDYGDSVGREVLREFHKHLDGMPIFRLQAPPDAAAAYSRTVQGTIPLGEVGVTPYHTRQQLLGYLGLTLEQVPRQWRADRLLWDSEAGCFGQLQGLTSTTLTNAQLEMANAAIKRSGPPLTTEERKVLRTYTMLPTGETAATRDWVKPAEPHVREWLRDLQGLRSVLSRDNCQHTTPSGGSSTTHGASWWPTHGTPGTLRVC